MTVLGALLGAAMGLILGTYVPPNRINVTFALVLTPAALHRLEPVPVALARPHPLVPGGLRGQPHDLRERGAARPDGPICSSHPSLDLLRGGRRFAGGAGRSGHGWIPPTVRSDNRRSPVRTVSRCRRKEGGW